MPPQNGHRFHATQGGVVVEEPDPDIALTGLRTVQMYTRTGLTAPLPVPEPVHPTVARKESLSSSSDRSVNHMCGAVPDWPPDAVQSVFVPHFPSSELAPVRHLCVPCLLLGGDDDGHDALWRRNPFATGAAR